MPIYEYKCENDHVFDVMQKMSEDPLTECVQCRAPVRKVLQPVGISFKGSGFYSTDYKNKNGSATKTEPAAKNGESSAKSDSTGKSATEKTSAKSESSTSKKD